MTILTVNKGAAKYIEAIKEGCDTNVKLANKFNVNPSTVSTSLRKAKAIGIILVEAIPLVRGGSRYRYIPTDVEYTILNKTSGTRINDHLGNKYEENMYSALDTFLYKHPDPKRSHEC